MKDLKHSSSTWRSGVAAVMLGGVALSQCGCLHHKFSGPGPEDLLPRMEAILSGPAALGFTNLPNLIAECTLSRPGYGEDSPLQEYSGRLAVSGGKLRLDATPRESKHASANGLGVIWDVNANLGVVFSEALQGYASIGGAARFTNLSTSPVAAPSERIGGHPVARMDLTAGDKNGQRILWHLACATDLRNLPLEIRTGDGPDTFTLTLAHLQPIQPAAALFLTPDGFTKYDSEPALVNELAGRQQRVFGPKPSGASDMDLEAGPPGQNRSHNDRQ